jgi:hypothetical protein
MTEACEEVVLENPDILGELRFSCSNAVVSIHFLIVKSSSYIVRLHHERHVLLCSNEAVSTGWNDAISEAVVARGKREQQPASGRDLLNSGRSPKVDPCLILNFVKLPALAEFLPYVSCNPLDGLADFHCSQSVSVRTFADRVDSCAVRGHDWF